MNDIKLNKKDFIEIMRRHMHKAPKDIPLEILYEYLYEDYLKNPTENTTDTMCHKCQCYVLDNPPPGIYFKR